MKLRKWEVRWRTRIEHGYEPQPCEPRLAAGPFWTKWGANRWAKAVNVWTVVEYFAMRREA